MSETLRGLDRWLERETFGHAVTRRMPSYKSCRNCHEDGLPMGRFTCPSCGSRDLAKHGGEVIQRRRDDR